MADFFIKRPVFTIVTALIILLIGGVSIPTLPVAQFPDVAPKQVSVSASYNSASAQTVEDSVTTLIEREINGVSGMRYVSSSSSNSGTSSISVTFGSSADQNLAAVDVQNRTSIAEARLPEEVSRTGVTVSKQSNSILLGLGISSENGEYDSLFMSNYADLYLVDALKRVDGVEEAEILGERRYAMRLWLDPDRLASRGLTNIDVANAIREQNIQVGAGRIGQQPAAEGQQFQIDLEAVSRLEDISEFENIAIAASESGDLVKLRDVGRVELGAQDYSAFLRYGGDEAVGIAIYQVPGSNALAVASAVKTEMERLSQNFPPGMTYGIGFDTTEYVEASLTEVFWTLIQAIGLVVLVIFIFLQDWRTTLVPALSIPVSLVGTFAFIRVFNFSINSLTLFGLILATGMVVDDAIVVVEDVAAKIQEGDLKPRRAAIEAMKELTGAVIATSLVLMAVFIPVAFFPGTTGALYRQFALTIAFAIAISTFNAITLTPMLCGLLLRRNTGSSGWLGKLFDKFNQGFGWLESQYEQALQKLVALKYWVIGAFVVMLVATAWLYTSVPSAFLPEEDQGYFITIIQGPEGVSLDYTSDVMAQAEEILLAQPETRTTFAIGGFSFSGNTANSSNPDDINQIIEITGSPAEGASSGGALSAMEEVADEVLPPGLGYEWSGTSLEEKTSGGQAIFIFGFGLILVFLVLAAQYESFTDPTIIMLSVPLAVMGALLAQSVRGLPNDLYCQIGLVMLIGLASKNAILIVEFANQTREEKGVSFTKAALAAAKQRMRPIIMTAISTLSSIFPLAIATGAGAGSRQSLGTAVFGGMLVATLLSLFVVPILYLVVKPIVTNLMPNNEEDEDCLPPGNQIMNNRKGRQNESQLTGSSS